MNRMLKSTLLVGASLMLTTSLAAGALEREGHWPDAEKKISVDLDRASRTDAVKKVADAAGWSIVYRGEAGDPVDVHVKDAPAGKVLDLMFADGDYVAKRDGNLVAIAKKAPSAAPDPKAASAAQAPAAQAKEDAKSKADKKDPKKDEAEKATAAKALDVKPAPRRGENREVFGGKTRIGKDEIVHDVTVFGGKADILGRVTGNVAVIGGKATVHEGAIVDGNATVVGGKLILDDDSIVVGDVGVVGGKLQRADSAKVGGKMVDGADDGNVSIQFKDGETKSWVDVKDPEERGVRGWLRDVGDDITRTAMLFAFGAVLLALAGGRMETMRVEIASRPMRSFALGIVSSIAGILATIALAITIIGIPVAIVGMLVAVFAAYAGICAALATFGKAIAGHRFESSYAHLAIGCVAFFIATAIPYVGGFVTFAATMIGLGVFVATRGAGIFPMPKAKGPPSSTPYREAAV